MKIIYKVILISLFIITLVGCDNKLNKVKFDRVESLNNSLPEYAPYSRYIKKQIITVKTDDKLERTITKEYDKQGRNILAYVISDIKIFNERSEDDYQNKTFNSYSGLFRINVKGQIVFDSMGKVSAYIGVATEDDKSEQIPFNRFIFYDENKIVSDETKFGAFLVENKLNWKDDVITHVTISFLNKYKDKFLSIEQEYNYDKQYRISKITSWAKSPNGIEKSETTLTDYNEFGDWTKGFVDRSESSQKSPTIVTREIEYW